jgi:hypothetical protein
MTEELNPFRVVIFAFHLPPVAPSAIQIKAFQALANFILKVI